MTAPDRIALRWELGAAVTSGPLMGHPDYTQYVRADLATPAAMTPEVEALVEAAERAEAKAKRLETALKLIELIGYREGKDWAWIASHMRGCATAAIKGDPLELYFRMVPGFPLAALRAGGDR